MAARHLQLLEDVRYVCLEGLDRDAEVTRRLPIGVAPGYEGHDLTLSGRQPLEVRRLRDVFVDVEQVTGNLSRYGTAAVQGLGHQGREVRSGGELGDVPICSRIEEADDVVT